MEIRESRRQIFIGSGEGAMPARWLRPSHPAPIQHSSLLLTVFGGQGGGLKVWGLEGGPLRPKTVAMGRARAFFAPHSQKIV
jgi:hypothetical protein